ncbi:MAG: hypothetical protein SGBAC_005767 [Bacillariaceae sp.]
MMASTNGNFSGSVPTTQPSRGEAIAIEDGGEITAGSSTVGSTSGSTSESTSTQSRTENVRRLEQRHARKNTKDPKSSPSSDLKDAKRDQKLRLDDNPILESPSWETAASTCASSKAPPSLSDNQVLDASCEEGGPMLTAEVSPNYEDEIQAARDRAVRDIEQMLKVQVAEVAEVKPRSNRKRLYYIIGALAIICAGGIAAAILLLSPKDESVGDDATITATTNYGDEGNILQQYFAAGTFIQVVEGGVDGNYTVACTDEVTDIGVVATNATSRAEQCVDSLPSSAFKSICESNGNVNVQLEGDHRGLVLGLVTNTKTNSSTVTWTYTAP